MTLGLVSKARKEKQLASMKRNIELQESNKVRWTDIKINKICRCGFETSGLMKDGKLVCPKCKEIL